MENQQTHTHLQMNHFDNMPFDIRETILNTKHSIEIDELKTTHTIAINAWEDEVREFKDMHNNVSQELDEMEGRYDELDTRVHGDTYIINGRYAIMGFCNEHAYFEKEDEYTVYDCVASFANVIFQGHRDIETYQDFIQSDGIKILFMVCEINDWNKTDMMVQIRDYNWTCACCGEDLKVNEICEYCEGCETPTSVLDTPFK